MRFLFIVSCLLAHLHGADCSKSISSSFDGVAKDGAKASVLVKNFDCAIFELIGNGFKPNESLCFVSNSYDEVLTSCLTAEENGELPIMMITPAVIGKSSGSCRISLLRKDGPIHIKFPWSIKE